MALRIYVDDKLSPLARMGVDSVAIVPSTFERSSLVQRVCRRDGVL